MNDNSDVDFEMLDRQLIALIGDERDALANTANFVALLFGALPDINWLGVYVLRGDELVLGPFQGIPACIRLPVGQGVCGTAARELRSLRVQNVQEFAGHIACDPASKSEVVVQLVIDGQLAGVLDIDSPRYGRFSERDQRGLESLCETFAAALASKGTTAREFI